SEGGPLRPGGWGGAGRSTPNELGGGEVVGQEFNGVGDRAGAVVEMTRLGAAEAIMTVSDGCYAQLLEDGAPALYRVWIEEQEARSSIGSGDAFLAGYVAASYERRPVVECLRYG